MKDKIKVQFIVIAVGQKCSLQCRDCGNLTPYLPQSFYNFDDICKDVQNVLTILNPSFIQLQGGEYFLYPKFSEFLIFLRSIFNERISIATNGTKLLTSTQLATVRDLNVNIRISDYDLCKQKSKKLMEQCQDNNISASLYKFAGKDGAWWNLEDQNFWYNNYPIAKKFNTCVFKGCLTLENGIIAKCSRATVSHLIQNFECNSSDFVLIRNRNPEMYYDELSFYINNNKAMKACYYCAGNKGEKIKPALQLKH